MRVGPAAGPGGRPDVPGVLLVVRTGGDTVGVPAVGADHRGRGEQFAVQGDGSQHGADPRGGHWGVVLGHQHPSEAGAFDRRAGTR